MSLGGIENMLVDILNRQVNDLMISLLIVDKGYDPEILSCLDSRIRIFRIGRIPGKKFCPFSIIKINHILFQEKFNIVHCHAPNLLKIFLIRPLLSSKFAITVHDTNIVYKKFSAYDRIFAISQAVSSDIMKRYKLKSIIVENGIHFDTIDRKTNFFLKKNKFSIIQVSRLYHNKKGQKLLIEAIDVLTKKYNFKNVQVLFVGDGPSKTVLIEYANKFNLSNKCIFAGSHNRKYIYSILKNFDLLVQPSLYEGFGLTIVEGIAAMIPVLVSNIEGPADIVQQGKYGYMFCKNDPHDLAFKIVKVIEEYKKPGFHKKLTDNFKYAKKRFDISKTADSYTREYSNLFKFKNL